MTVDELNERFGIPGAAAFEAGPGGLTKMTISAAGGEAAMTLHGAHVMHFAPAGAEGVLWMSRRSWIEPGKPIRGGVPVCFPWFGTSGPGPNAPNHGFARLMIWDVESVRQQPGGDVAATLVLAADDSTRAFWPGQFELQHTVTVGGTLSMRLETRNTGDEPFAVTEALHSYFAVSDVRKVTVGGLEGGEYVDTAGEPRRCRQDDAPIAFSAETDRLYVGTGAACVLDDPGLGRKITVAKSGSASTVVWNPWAAKAARMPDYYDDEWPGMLCIETANVGEDAVTIVPGEAHNMAARISVGP